MVVADILKLGPGSIIELDRLAGGTVDLLLTDRLWARGEVVVVDENFGVRLTELIERPDAGAVPIPQTAMLGVENVSLRRFLEETESL